MRRLRTQALPIAVVVLVLLVLVIGWLASNVAQDWITKVATVPTSTITPTPPPTTTPFPTSSPTPTATVTATPTSTPTVTPYPTYTPYPTFTPFPSPTPVPCNAARRDPTTVGADLAGSPQQARDILGTMLRHWTRAGTLPRLGSPTVRFYLTYLSPQVVEAVVLDSALRLGLPAERRPELLIEYDRRLSARNALPFILMLRGPQNGALQVRFPPPPQSLVLISQNRQSIPAASDFAPVFNAPIGMDRGGAGGYVLFPRSLGTGCNPTVNLAIDRSFDVRLAGVGLSGFLSVPFMSNDQVTWSFDALPETSLEQALRIPLPKDAADVDGNTLADIEGLTFNLFDAVLK